MSEEFPGDNPNDNPENINQESEITENPSEEYPEFDKEKAQKLRDEYGSNNNLPNDSNEITKTKEQLMLDQQLDDASVLLSFCDEKSAMDILHSDAYGALLENQVSLVDLFNADALFDEQYYLDGYTADGWRYGYEDFLGDYDGKTKLGRKKNNRQRESEKIIEMRGYLKGRENYGAADELYDEKYEGDEMRARDAKETIQNIFEEYFSDYADEVEAAEFKEILHIRANDEDISNEQKDFLKQQWNPAAERLLYNGHVFNEERANNISHGLEEIINDYDNAKEKNESLAGTLVSRMFYAEAAISDFEEAGKPDLVVEAKKKLSEGVDKYFDVIVNTHLFNMSDDLKMSRFDHIDRLVFKYSDPYELVERAKEYNLCGREYDWFEHDRYLIREPDWIVRYITRAREEDFGYDKDAYLSYEAKDLKELGVSDDAIMEHCNNLHPVDFINAETIDGIGTRLLEAGIDRQKVLDNIFSSRNYNRNPFEKQGYPFIGESYFDVLERNGFSATEIAETFSPDTISENLSGFLERGADAKELMEYMISYHEEFEDNKIFNEEGETAAYSRVWLEGLQDVMVWDKNHPEGRVIHKIGMHYRGIDYVAANFDLFAENGITENDILQAMPDHYASPNNCIVSEMTKCKKFDTNKVLRAGYEKERKYLESRLEDGTFDKGYVEIAIDPIRYVADVLKRADDNNIDYNPIREIKRQN